MFVRVCVCVLERERQRHRENMFKCGTCVHVPLCVHLCTSVCGMYVSACVWHWEVCVFVHLCIFMYECMCGVFEHLWVSGVCACYVCVTFPVALSRALSLGSPRFLSENSPPTQYKEPTTQASSIRLQSPKGE